MFSRTCLSVFLSVSFLLSLISISNAEASGPTMECLPIAGEPDNFSCVVTTTNQEIGECKNEDDRCAAWARKGECKNNPKYMLYNCRESCQSCLGLHIGETQVSPDDSWRRKVLNRLIETQRYVYDKAATQYSTFQQCQNDHEMCTYWALQGDCKKNEGFMEKSCRAACKTCHK